MGVLDGCGRYSEQLNEMAKSILAQKSKNGEKLIDKDKDSVENDIFQAYQTILSVLRDSNDISKAVSNLQKQVSNSGVTEVSKISYDAIKDALREKEMTEKNSKESTVLNNQMTKIAENIKNEIKDYKISFSPELKNYVKSQIEKTKDGSDKSAVMLYFTSQLEIVKRRILKDKDYFNIEKNPNAKSELRKLSKYIDGARRYSNGELDPLIIEIASMANLDILQDGSDEKKIGDEKLESFVKEHAGKRYIEDRGTSREERLITRLAEKMRRDNDFENLTVEDVEKKSSEKLHIDLLRTEIKKAEKTGDREPLIRLIALNEGISKRFMQEQIDEYNEDSKQGKSASILSRSEKRCLILSDAYNQYAEREKARLNVPASHSISSNEVNKIKSFDEER